MTLGQCFEQLYQEFRIINESSVDWNNYNEVKLARARDASNDVDLPLPQPEASFGLGVAGPRSRTVFKPESGLTPSAIFSNPSLL